MTGSSFYGIYGRSYSGGVTYTSISGFTSSDLPSSGDSVIVRYESSGNALRVYVNGSEVFNTTGSFNATAASNRSLLLLESQKTTQNFWHGVRSIMEKKMPTSWFMKIKDLWIANNANVTASEASAIATAISSNDDLSTYSNYSANITHHWDLVSDLEADKGDYDLERK